MSSNLDSTAPSYGQTHPGMGALPPTPHLPPPEYTEYNQIIPTANSTGMAPSPGAINNQEMFQNPHNYNPMYSGGKLHGGNSPAMAFPPPVVSPYPAGPMIHGMMPPPQYPVNGSYPSQGYFNPAQPMVVTMQPAPMVDTSPGSGYKDYLVWSILNMVFCCLACGAVALIFSIQTRSANQYQNWESARRKSYAALSFNLIAMIVGIGVIIGLSVYYTQYYKSYPMYTYYG